jgi:mannan endo-1,4-beta-mannosidase
MFKIFFVTIFLITEINLAAQNEFISVRDKKFSLNENEFKFLGFNAYYLLDKAADPDTRYIIDDVFKTAQSIGVNVIRTWAFFEDSSENKIGAIRTAPYKYHESSLRALDYIIQQAKENNVYLILTLSNNFGAYGGIPAYLAWADKYLGGNFSHSDFFTHDSLRHWFKNYLSRLLNRQNSLTGIFYKDDPTIFSFELMNEAENPRMPASIIKNWYEEMSNYLRSIDTNHLITTGEIGFDAFKNLYSDTDLFYNGSSFLVDGFKGTSYFENQFLENIDYLSFHIYPEGWGLSALAGKTWIKDHFKISQYSNKPVLLGEFGIRKDKLKVYNDWLDEIKKTDSKSAVAWQYLHPDIDHYDDGHGFNQFNSPELFSLFKSFIEEINTDTFETIIPADAILYQNYPNPFNPVTVIKYSLPQDDFVSIKIHNSIGELVIEGEKGYKTKGEHELILSFDNDFLSSGIYIYTLWTSKTTISKKLILLK